MKKNPRQLNWEVIFHSSTRKKDAMHSSLTRCYRAIVVIVGVLTLLYGISGVIQ